MVETVLTGSQLQRGLKRFPLERRGINTDIFGFSENQEFILSKLLLERCPARTFRINQWAITSKNACCSWLQTTIFSAKHRAVEMGRLTQGVQMSQVLFQNRSLMMEVSVKGVRATCWETKEKRSESKRCNNISYIFSWNKTLYQPARRNYFKVSSLMSTQKVLISWTFLFTNE